MTTLSTLFDADLRTRKPVLRRLSEQFTIPHPLHAVEYADGIWLCDRPDCEPCRSWVAAGAS